MIIVIMVIGFFYLPRLEFKEKTFDAKNTIYDLLPRHINHRGKTRFLFLGRETNRTYTYEQIIFNEIIFG